LLNRYELCVIDCMWLVASLGCDLKHVDSGAGSYHAGLGAGPVGCGEPGSRGHSMLCHAHAKPHCIHAVSAR
jgi:hypothetical protein